MLKNNFQDLKEQLSCESIARQAKTYKT